MFTPTPLPGAFVVEPEPHSDERGYFARTFCAQEFTEHGLCASYPQCSTSYNVRAGTLRGLHYQVQPHAEAKLVRVARGAIYDVIVDLRPHSTRFKKWFAVELTAANLKMLYIPEGLAHGFQTLVDDTEVCYQISAPYQAEAARGARWNDPAFAIRWPPCASRLLSARDASYPDFHG